MLTSQSSPHFSGDPTNFQAFLKEKQLPLSIIPRYIGNKFNNFFTLSAIVFSMKQDILTYLNGEWNY